jgi:hypothetical protein
MMADPPGVGAAVVLDQFEARSAGEIRTEADFGPAPCMIGIAALPGYFAS